MLWKSSIHSGHFKSWYFWSKFRKFRKFRKFKRISSDALLLYELSEREPGWRFTARCHSSKRSTKSVLFSCREAHYHSTSLSRGNQVDGLPRVCQYWCIGNPVPRAPRLFMTLTSFNMFLVDKTMLIWKCTTWKVFFMYWSLILAKY